jgi:hypothetical protein
MTLPNPICTRQPSLLFHAICTPNRIFVEAPNKPVILSEAPRRFTHNGRLMARSRRTPAMLAGRCSSELSSHKPCPAVSETMALIDSTRIRLFPSEKDKRKGKDGCPTFAEAYVGRKRRGEAPSKLLKTRTRNKSEGAPHPDFLWNPVAPTNFMRPSLQKGARAALSSAANRKFGVSRSFFARCGIPHP